MFYSSSNQPSYEWSLNWEKFNFKKKKKKGYSHNISRIKLHDCPGKQLEDKNHSALDSRIAMVTIISKFSRYSTFFPPHFFFKCVGSSFFRLFLSFFFVLSFFLLLSLVAFNWGSEGKRADFIQEMKRKFSMRFFASFPRCLAIHSRATLKWKSTHYKR